MTYTLVIANKAYSSWSFRPWILLRHFGIPFEDVVIPLAQETTREQILRYSPAAKCPVLIDGETRVWESLAIIEYVAESNPDLAIWPKDKAARALARSLSSEMHAGYQSLRGHLPMNIRRKVAKRELTPEAAADLARIEAAWAAARRDFGKSGDFLFGDFCAADAMFAPVVSRLHSYDAPVTAASRTYMNRIMALPAWRAWENDANLETWHIEKYEV
jgi:glutathione S-transferase